MKERNLTDGLCQMSETMEGAHATIDLHKQNWIQ